MIVHQFPIRAPLLLPRTSRKKLEEIPVVKAEKSRGSGRTANLTASRSERIKLPEYKDGSGRLFHINEFLSHPMGLESLLNKRALQRFESLDSNTYRCTLEKVQLLNLEATPVLDLRVIPTEEDCMVELLSCRLEGSRAIEEQNRSFSAFMTNHIRWEIEGSGVCLVVDVNLKLTLEVFSVPFNLLPLQAIEGPGNLVMQSLLDRLVPLLVDQLLRDYGGWAEEQLEVIILYKEVMEDAELEEYCT